MSATPIEQGYADGEPSTLHYRATAEAVASPEEAKPAKPTLRPDSDNLADRILYWLTITILAVVLAVWAVVGAVFWLPLLIRTMFRFSLALVQSTMDDERPEGSASMLRNAVGFYRRGFVVAIDAVLPGAPLREGKIRRERIEGRRMFRELLWALAIWYVVLWFIGVAWSPAEIGAWILGWPWGEAFGSLWDGFTGFLDSLLAPAAPGAAPVTPESVPAPVPLPGGATTG